KLQKEISSPVSARRPNLLATSPRHDRIALRDQGSMFKVQSSKFSHIRNWAGFVKLSHTVFALPFALASMAVAARENRGWPGWRTFGLILAAMVCARTCAMAFNRIVDRDFDRDNPRTSMRHLPSGLISLSGAWMLCLLSAAGLIVAS